MYKSNATKIDKYVTTNSFNEKVELRTYESGFKRCYIYQGGTWYGLRMWLFNHYKTDGTIIEDQESAAAWGRIVYADSLGINN